MCVIIFGKAGTTEADTYGKLYTKMWKKKCEEIMHGDGEDG